MEASREHRENNLPEVLVASSSSSPEVVLPGKHNPFIDSPEAYTPGTSTITSTKELQPGTYGDLDNGEPTKRAGGLRRRNLWIIGIIASIIILAAAIGGGVAGSRAANSKTSSSSSSTKGESGTASGSSPEQPSIPNTDGITISPQSKLASLNYTDINGVAYNVVYFQATNKALYQSRWNSTGMIWGVMPITTQEQLKNVTVKDNTPLAADIFWHSPSEIDIHLSFLDSTNTIQQLQQTYNAVSSPLNLDPWILTSYSGKYIAAETSSLVSFGKACSVCPNSGVIVYQAPNNELQVARLSAGNGGQVVQAPVTTQTQNSNLASPGSSMVIVPFVFDDEPGRGLFIYVRGGKLRQLHVGDTAVWNYTDRLDKIDGISNNVQLASFTYSGVNVAGTQLLLAEPNIPGLGLTSYSTDRYKVGWSRVIIKPSVFSTVAVNSSVAANLAGMVYAFEDGENGKVLVEWRFDGDTKYTRIGAVGVDIP